MWHRVPIFFSNPRKISAGSITFVNVRTHVPESTNQIPTRVPLLRFHNTSFFLLMDSRNTPHDDAHPQTR